MASVNSLKVNAVKGRSTRDLSFDHVTTIDFNVVKPVGIFELVPGDHINVSPELWMRTQPMNVPTFGKMDVITRAFFVPLRLAWRHYNDFYRSAPIGGSQLGILNYFNSVPHVSMNDLSMEFIRRFKVYSSESSFISYNRGMEEVDGIAKRLSFGAQYQASGAGSTLCEFTMRQGAACFLFKFNPIGKRIYDLFNSIGYRFQFFVPDGQPTSTTKGTSDNVYDVSLLPLVGWLKLFQDWYCPSEYKYLFSENILDGEGTSPDNDFIKKLFDELTWAVFIYFNDDIFSMCEQAPYLKGQSVSINRPNIYQLDDAIDSYMPDKPVAWHTHNNITTDYFLGARNSGFEGFDHPEDANPSGDLYYKNQRIMNGAASSDVPKTVQSTSSQSFVASGLNQQVSSWSVMAVIKTAQWLQRNNLLSSRATEYLKAKFGVTPTSARLQIVEYIGHAGAPVKISDIACTTEDNLAELGAKGTGYSIDKFSYTAEEFGYLFVTTELRPRIGYGQGVDPLVLRTQLEEFYNEEFDSLGFEPVPTECLNSGPNSFLASRTSETMNIGTTDNRIFGYLPRLWSYKCKHDNMSGDFLLPNQRYGDLQSYHLMRCVRGNDIEDYIHNSLSFRYAGLCVKENNFGRIFRSDDNDYVYDHFQLICSFEAFVNGIPLALNESWQVNSDHDEREGHLTNIQASL